MSVGNEKMMLKILLYFFKQQVVEFYQSAPNIKKYCLKEWTCASESEDEDE